MKYPGMDLHQLRVFQAAVKNGGFTRAGEALPSIPHLYFVDSVGGVNRSGTVIESDFFVDVKSTFAVKREMLAKHASQRAWLKRQHGIDDYIETMENWTRERGLIAGIEYAEGFRRYPGHPYPQTPLLEELLGSKAIVHTRRG